MLDKPESRQEVAKKALFGDELNKKLKENWVKTYQSQAII